MRTANPGGSGRVSVRVVVTNANGQDADVTVTDFIRVGDSINRRINVIAAEAAARAFDALNFDNPLDIDRTRPRRTP